MKQVKTGMGTDGKVDGKDGRCLCNRVYLNYLK